MRTVQPLEIEAKFVVPDAATRKQLGSVSRLGEYRLGPPKILHVRDTFYDSKAASLEAVWYVLRMRIIDHSRALLTLKTPAQRSGAVYRRPEIEVRFSTVRAPSALSTRELPRRIRELVEPIVGTSALYPKFSINQTRGVRRIYRSRQIVAEWSLDRVRYSAPGRKHAFDELEIERKGHGTEKDLERLAGLVVREWGLGGVTKGKFQRALEFMRDTDTSSSR
jgi:inorganic triphosphatase YgiF